MLEVDGERGQIDIRAGQNHLLHRRFLAADLDEFRLEAQPPQDLGQQLLRGDAEGVRDACAACQHIADQGMAAGGLEQHGFRVALERAGDLAQSGLARPALELLSVKRIDEGAQPIALEIDRGCGACRHLLQAHRGGPGSGGLDQADLGEQRLVGHPEHDRILLGRK